MYPNTWPLVPNSAAQTETDAAISQLASIVEFSNDAIMSKTLDGVITHWNSSAEKLFTRTKEATDPSRCICLSTPPSLWGTPSG